MSDPASGAWTPAERVIFRFGFLYLLLYFALEPISTALFTATLEESFRNLVDPPQFAIARRFVGLFGWEVQSSADVRLGSDYAVSYALALTKAVGAAVGAAVWSLLDRSRTEYRRLYDLLRVYLRYSLAAILLSYGVAKLLPVQFPRPSYWELTQPLGDLSPMGLLWAFMGYSRPFTLFSGVGECVAATLLFWRRTTLLGSLIAISVLSVVVAMNFSYDVPVKLSSSHLLLAAVVLTLPDLPRLARLLVLNTSVPKGDLGRLFQTPRAYRLSRRIKPLVIALIVLGTVSMTRSYIRGVGVPEEAGVYDVESFVRNGELIPPLESDETRWRRLMIDGQGDAIVVVEMMNASWPEFEGVVSSWLEVDPSGESWSFATGAERAITTTLEFRESQDGTITLSGEWQGDTIEVRLRRREGFLLLDRGFHLIQDGPVFQ